MSWIPGGALRAARDLRPRTPGDVWETEDDLEIEELYRLSKTAVGVATHGRMLWTSDHYNRRHPQVSTTRAYKRIERLGL